MAWIKIITVAFLVLLPPMLVADTQLQVIDKLDKFEQKNIGNLEPWDVAHLFGLTKVRRTSEWTALKLLYLQMKKLNYKNLF